MARLCSIRPGDATPASLTMCLLCALRRQPGTWGGSVPDRGHQAWQARDQRQWEQQAWEPAVLLGYEPRRPRPREGPGRGTGAQGFHGAWGPAGRVLGGPPPGPEASPPPHGSPMRRPPGPCGRASGSPLCFSAGPCACCREDPPLVSFLPLLAVALGTLQGRVRGQEALPHGEWPREQPHASTTLCCLCAWGRLWGQSWGPGPAPGVRVWGGGASVCAPATRTALTLSSLSPKKESVSPGPVFSVDYEELDFQWQEKTPETSAPSVPQETEYATIVFPGRPGSPTRRASADSPQGPWPPRLEDGRCSWPL